MEEALEGSKPRRVEFWIVSSGDSDDASDLHLFSTHRREAEAYIVIHVVTYLVFTNFAIGEYSAYS